jgi:hypothetical protein
MPGPITNYGNTYFNVNECHSFQSTHGGTALYPLSSQPASQVTIYNTTAQPVHIYDKNSRVADAAPNDDKRILIPAASATTPLQGVVFMGLTNADELSAKHATSPAVAAPLCYRTQYFSSNPAR